MLRAALKQSSDAFLLPQRPLRIFFSAIPPKIASHQCALLLFILLCGIAVRSTPFLNFSPIRSTLGEFHSFYQCETDSSASARHCGSIKWLLVWPQLASLPL